MLSRYIEVQLVFKITHDAFNLNDRPFFWKIWQNHVFLLPPVGIPPKTNNNGS